MAATTQHKWITVNLSVEFTKFSRYHWNVVCHSTVCYTSTRFGYVNYGMWGRVWLSFGSSAEIQPLLSPLHLFHYFKQYNWSLINSIIGAHKGYLPGIDEQFVFTFLNNCSSIFYNLNITSTIVQYMHSCYKALETPLVWCPCNGQTKCVASSYHVNISTCQNWLLSWVLAIDSGLQQKRY